MKFGVILPTFRDTPDEALETARRAEELGLDGVFCYDHIWPMGQRDRPALAPFPVLGLLAQTTCTVALGTLVARVGLVPTSKLVDQFATLDVLAPGRIVAGLGVGDHLSQQENLAYGIEYAPAAVRLDELRRLATTLHARGMTVWLGGRHSTRAMAAELGVVANLWDAPLDEVAEQAVSSEVTWAGPTPQEPDALTERVAALRRAEASWAVFAYPTPLEQLAAIKAASTAG